MRLLFIICEASIENRVIEALNRAGAPGYTRFTGATGSGRRGVREGTSVWPGLNSLIMAGLPEDLVPDVVDSIEKLQAERGGRLAIKAFSVPAEEFS